MNRLYDRNLYFLALISLYLNPLNFKNIVNGVEIELDDYKLIIQGNIIPALKNCHLSKGKKEYIEKNFTNKISIMASICDKYGVYGRTFFEKYIPNNKFYIFEENNLDEILDFILDSDNKLKNITNYNIQYECSQLRCTENMQKNISKLLRDSFIACEERKNNFSKINVK